MFIDDVLRLSVGGLGGIRIEKKFWALMQEGVS